MDVWKDRKGSHIIREGSKLGGEKKELERKGKKRVEVEGMSVSVICMISCHASKKKTKVDGDFLVSKSKTQRKERVNEVVVIIIIVVLFILIQKFVYPLRASSSLLCNLYILYSLLGVCDILWLLTLIRLRCFVHTIQHFIRDSSGDTLLL